MGFANTLSPPTRDPRIGIEIVDDVVDVLADVGCTGIGRKGVSEAARDLGELFSRTLDLHVSGHWGDHRVRVRVMYVDWHGRGRTAPGIVARVKVL